MSQKQTNKIGIDALVLTGAKIATTLINLVVVMLLARFRTLEEYGTFSQIMLTINLIVAIIMMGLPNSINYFLASSNDSKESQQFLSTFYTLSTLLCVVIGVFLAICSPWVVVYFDNPEIKEYVYFMAIFPWCCVITGSISNVLVVYGKTILLTIYNIVSLLITLAAVVLVEIVGWSFKEYMVLYLLVNVFMTLWAYLIVWREAGTLKIYFDYTLIKKIIRYSVPIGLANIVGTLSLEVDKLVVARLFNTETLAYYTNAAKELPFTIVATSLSAVLLPQIVRLLNEKEDAKAISLWKTTIELSYIFMSFIVTALIVFAPQIMTLLYSEKYLPGLGVFRVYSLVLLLRITYFGMVLTAKGYTKPIFYVSIFSLFLNTVLDVLLYFIFGLVGPAIATFISIFIVAFVLLKITSNLESVSIMELLPLKRIIQHSIINVIWGILVYVFLALFNIGVSSKEIMGCILLGIIITALYGCLEYKSIKGLWSRLNRSS